MNPDADLVTRLEMDAREELAEKVARRGQPLYPILEGRAREHTLEAAQTLVDEVLAHPDLVIAALGGKMYQFLDGDFVYRFPVREGTDG